ncbi:MAG: restriction endonuclease subunit S [Thermodesulfobacteriota bacterium]|nr:restriction endonuclease subunit S [Thermodesulfobacteriota bacterium]
MRFPRYESYKDSGVEWLGEIPRHWQVKRNIGIFDERKKVNRPEMDLLSVTINQGIIQQNEITTKKDSSNEDKTKYKVVEKGDLAYNKMRMWQGAIGASSYDGIVSPAYIILRPRDKAYSRYYHYLYRTPLFIKEANRHSYGLCDDMNSLRYEHFKTIYSSVPPSDEIDKITNFLDQKTAEIDEAIAKKEQLITLLQEQKAILINQVVTKGLNPNAPMKDSGVEWLGEIPSHWQVKKNKTLFEERKIPGKEELPILSVSLHTGVSEEEQSGDVNLRAKVRIEDKSSYKLVKKGYIAFNMMRAWQGAIGVVKTEGMVSPAYIVAEPVGKIDGEYFEYLYRTAGFIAEMDRFSKGITDFRKRLYWDEFKQLLTIFPPQKEQLAIAKHVKRLNSSCDQLSTHVNHEIEKLVEYRSVLIANTVTGQIRV